MRLEVYGHGVELTEELHSRIEVRVAATFERFGRRVRRVTVRLHRPSDDAGDLCTCHILVEWHPSGGVGLGDTAWGPFCAFDRAADRVAAAVARGLAVSGVRRDSRTTAYALR